MIGLSLSKADTRADRGRSGRQLNGTLLFVVALLQTLALAWMIYGRVSLITSGREVVLATVPVDPRSLFRGDYVILNYEISRLEPENLKGDKSFKKGADIFVSLKKSDTLDWKAVSAGKSYPLERKPDEVVIRGKVRYARKNSISVKYGIEAFFVPEGQGKALEKRVRERNLQVLVAVGNGGEPAIKGLLVDGERKYEETPF